MAAAIILAASASPWAWKHHTERRQHQCDSRRSEPPTQRQNGQRSHSRRSRVGPDDFGEGRIKVQNQTHLGSEKARLLPEARRHRTAGAGGC
eukprot:2751522-Rhodomonas_salina.2